MDFSDNPELLAIFHEEVGERSAELSSVMKDMAERTLSPDEVATARRNAHTIKGNAYVMGFQRLGDVSKVVEDALKEVVGDSRPQSAHLGLLVAAVSDLFPVSADAGPEGDVSELLAAEKRLVAFLTGNTVPPPPTPDRHDEPESEDVAPTEDAEVVDIAEKLAKRQINEAPTDLGGLVSAIVTDFAAHSTRVATSQLYQLINRAVEVRLDMEVVLGALERVVANPDDRQSWDDALRTLERSVVQLQTDALDLATVPLSEITSTLEQLVKYVSRKTGKNVKFELVGSDAHVDRQVVDALRDPLRHLVVNALDHGIESPEERQRLGKPSTATVRVGFEIDGHVLRVSVTDDGRGVDWGAVHTVAATEGLTTDSQASDDLAKFLFLPAFTTVQPPESISGDGAGLAAVQDAARILNGDVRMASSGAGTEISLVLPRSLVLQDLWIVEAEGQQWGIPEASVVAALPAPEVIAGFVEFRGGQLPVRRLSEIVGAASNDASNQLVVIGSQEGQAGLLVTDVVGRRQVAVKSLGAILEETPHLAGAAHLGGDEVVVVVDPSQLISTVQRPALDLEYRPTILVVDDSPGVRQLISATLGMNGFDVVVASDARDALDVLVESAVDALVVDFQMPGPNGIELVQQVRSVRQRMPIIMVSGVATKIDQQAAFRAGVDAFLDKSDFRHGALATTLWDLIDGSSQTDVAP